MSDKPNPQINFYGPVNMMAGSTMDGDVIITVQGNLIQCGSPEEVEKLKAQAIAKAKENTASQNNEPLQDASESEDGEEEVTSDSDSLTPLPWYYLFGHQYDYKSEADKKNVTNNLSAVWDIFKNYTDGGTLEDFFDIFGLVDGRTPKPIKFLGTGTLLAGFVKEILYPGDCRKNWNMIARLFLKSTGKPYASLKNKSPKEEESQKIKNDFAKINIYLPTSVQR